MYNRHRCVAVALAWLYAAGLWACNPLRRQRAPRSDAPPVLIFENQSLEQAAVYAVARGGPQVRIGTVQAGRTDTLVVGPGALDAGGSVTIVARLLAMSGMPSTGPLTLQPGDRLLIRLPPNARLLSVLPAIP